MMRVPLKGSFPPGAAQSPGFNLEALPLKQSLQDRMPSERELWGFSLSLLTGHPGPDSGPCSTTRGTAVLLPGREGKLHMILV